MRCVEWFWQPDPAQRVAMAEYVFTLRGPGPDGALAVRVVHDRHRCGLFPIAAWRSAFEAAGLRAEAISRDLGEEPGLPYWWCVWLLRAPKAEDADLLERAAAWRARVPLPEGFDVAAELAAAREARRKTDPS